MLRGVMSEPNNTTTPSAPAPSPAKLVSVWTKRLAGPLLTLFGCGLITGLALSGLGLMALSAAAWLYSGAGWFCGIGLLTGGMFFASAMALALGQLSKICDTLYLAYSTK